MRKIVAIYILALAAISVYAQNDPQAKAILDQVSAKNKAYKTINTAFAITGTNTQNADKTTQKGTLLIKGDKYMIKLPDSEVYFDGKDVYNYLPASNEVNITKPQASTSKGDDIFISNPKDVFKIYQKDFKQKFIKETTESGKQVYEIDLYPVDLKKKYNRIRLHIEKSSSQIVSMKAFFKDGFQYSIAFDKFEVNKEIPDNTFVFEKSKYPNVEVIDLRF
jgi:outer membrane lipoprotein-sorting protein